MGIQTTKQPQPPGDGQPLGKQSQRFARTKAALSRQNLDRGYHSMADHAWYGMGDVWWALTHPHKAFARHVGHLSMIVVVVSGFGAVGYLFFGEPNSAQLSLEEPGSILKVASDQTIRPAARFIRNALGGAAESVGSDEDGYDGEDYRE